MRVLSLLSPALLAAVAVANEQESSSSSSSAASSSSATPDEPTPAGQLWTASWTSSSLTPYHEKCRSTSIITAQIYKLQDMYPALKDWAPNLKVFYNKQLYPGSWSGEDKHGDQRELLKMQYEDLPFAVREWIVGHPKQRWFAVDEGVVFFAPGAMYPTLPLWVDAPVDDKLGECEGTFDDLENYSNEPRDGVVVAKMSHKSTGKNRVEITVEAMQLQEKSDFAKARDEL